MEPTIVKAVKKKRYGYHSIVITLSDGTTQEIDDISGIKFYSDSLDVIKLIGSTVPNAKRYILDYLDDEFSHYFKSLKETL